MSAPPPTATRQTADFFENQARALRRTSWLVAMFCLAVVLIIVAIYTVIVVVLQTQGAKGGIFNPELMLLVGGAVVAVVGCGTLYKIAALRRGGRAVAEMLGGIAVLPETTDEHERRLLNVVAEMSLASGCPTPAVYTLPRESSINAFAAGFGTSDAAVAVTHGALMHLNRDELQGVIAHEFSHIMRGDMRLNMRLIGVLHGILLIAIIGEVMMRAASQTSGRRRSNDKNNGAAVVVILGLALFIIGYIGVFFARIIKSAVSRQREFLADSAAVQFTRNPNGIAGALMKIGGLSDGSRIRNAHAEEASHMLFGDGASRALSLVPGLMSTHPPIDQRIRAILPSFDGTFKPVRSIPAVGEERFAPIAEPMAPPPPVIPYRQGNFPITMPPGILAGAAGTLAPAAIVAARATIEAIPEELMATMRRPGGAMAVVYAALAPEKDADALISGLAQEYHFEVRRAVQLMQQRSCHERMAILELALPALRQANPETVQKFLTHTRRFIDADKQTTLFELCVWRVLQKTLGEEGLKRARQGPQFYSIAALLPNIAMLLNAIAWAGADNQAAAAEAFRRGASMLGTQGRALSLLGREANRLDALEVAFDRLESATPDIKRRVVAACAAAVSADKITTADELTLLRAVCMCLECPIPLVAGERAAS